MKLEYQEIRTNQSLIRQNQTEIRRKLDKSRINQTFCKLQKLDKNQTKIRQKLEEISNLRKLDKISTSEPTDEE